MVMLIDAHSHLDRYDLENEGALESALNEITQNRIFTISNSLDLPSFQRNLAIGERCKLVLPIFGIHPWMAPHYAHRLDELGDTVRQSPMIGEIGLDHFFVKDSSAFPDQNKVLEFFLTAAREQEKVVSLHTKGAEEAVLELLCRYEISRAIVHWYSGPLDILRDLAARGAYFTVGIEVLFSDHIKTIVREIPSRQLLTETDNPGGPQAFLGRGGMPILIRDIVESIARVRGVAVEDIIQTVWSNMLRLIRDDARLTDACAGCLEE